MRGGGAGPVTRSSLMQSDGGFNGVGFGVFDGTDAELKRCGVHIVCGDGSLDGMGVEGNV